MRTRWIALVLLVAFPRPVGGAEDPAMRTFGLAQELLREGRVDQALEAFGKVVEGYPASEIADDALYQIARRAFPVERPEELGRAAAAGALAAKPIVERILQEYPAGDRAPDAGVLLGLIHMVPGSPTYHLEKAFAAFREVVAVHPGSEAVPRALRGSALAEMAMGRPGPALLYLERLLMEHPVGPLAEQARLDAADAYLRLGKRREAFVMLRPLRLRVSDPVAGTSALDLMTLLLRLDAPQMGFRLDGSYQGPPERPGQVLEMAFDAAGALHLLVDGGKVLWRLGPDGRLLERRPVQDGACLFRSPAGEIGWVSEAGLHTAGTVLVPRRSERGEIRRIQGLCPVVQLPDGSFFAADASRRQLVRLGPDGAFRGAVATETRVVDLETDRRGKVYALDARQRTIRTFLPDGTVERLLGPTGAGFEFGSPVDLAVSEGYQLHVLDTRAATTLVFDDQGRLVARVPADDGRRGALRDARAIAVERSGALVLYDGRARRLMRYH